MGVEGWRIRTQGNATSSLPTPVSPEVQGEGVMVIVTLIVAFIAMAGDWAPPEIVFTVVNSLFHTAGIVTDAQAASGYGNTGLLTVIFLYLVAEGVYQTGALEGIMLYVLGRSRSPFWAIIRLSFPVMFVSAFLNNTPIVALMVPILIAWARRSGVPVKKVLIPLSFAATIGGTCTLIGTSTNLVISGQQNARYTKQKKFDDAQFGIFDIAPYGVPYALWGMLFIALTQRWLLPGNSSKYAKDLLMALRVTKTSTILGKTIGDSGLKKMHGAKFVGYQRNGVWNKSSDASDVLLDGDILYVVGELSDVGFYSEDYNLLWLNHTIEDEANAKELAVTLGSATKAYDKLVQVTVKPTAEIVGKRISDVDFQSVFHAVVVAFKRGAEESNTAIYETVLQAGDILVLNEDEECDTYSSAYDDNFSHMHHITDGADKSFITSLTINAKSSLIGQTMSQASLRGIPGLHAFAIDRASGERLDVIPIETLLEEGDVVWVSADLLAFAFLGKIKGISMSAQSQVKKTKVDIIYRELTQAVVAPSSLLVGKTLPESGFREKYTAAVVAIGRDGEVAKRLPLTTTEIKAGDVLLLDADRGFAKTNVADKGFSVLLSVRGSSPPKRSKGWIALMLTTAMVAIQVINGLLVDHKDYKSLVSRKLYRTEIISLWPGAVLTAFLMLCFKCMTFKQATDSILWDVYLTIAAAFGVSVATETTGVAKAIANVFVSIARHTGGDGAAMTAIYIATAVLSEILTNNAAGAVMYPIAATAADELGIDPKYMSIAIMLGASAGFINPYSYQCNLMVYSAGNYTFKEFATVGAPFQVYLAIIAAIILFNINNWQTIWIITWLSVAGVIAVAAIWTIIPGRITMPVEHGFDTYFVLPLYNFFNRFLFTPIGFVVSSVLRPIVAARNATKAAVAKLRRRSSEEDSQEAAVATVDIKAQAKQ